MARYYNRRDDFKHWVRKRQPADRPCTHACCRGFRAHPEHYPVILPRRTLRRATDEDLARHFNKVSAGTTGQDRWAEAQILSEMQRRDDELRLRRQRREAVAANRAAAQMEREAVAERIRADAERETKGYLVNPLGRARGISDAEILTGREDVFRRYATDEAREFFASTPRPTAAYLRYGRDTRVHERYTEPRRRTPRRTRALGWGTALGPGPGRRGAVRALGWGERESA